ncbi:MAG: four helix bundle protein [Deltaproteobacteria bacterium]|nr:four helix bundle protein [Deltaproteobacteria bacterium]
MARYEHIPIFKAAMDLGVYLEGMVHNFSRYHKYTTGQELRNLGREIIKLIIRANSARDKQSILSELVIQCEMLKTMLFFAKESGAIQSFKAFQHASSLAVVLCRQSEGWLKNSRKGRNHQPSESEKEGQVSEP